MRFSCGELVPSSFVALTPRGTDLAILFQFLVDKEPAELPGLSESLSHERALNGPPALPVQSATHEFDSTDQYSPITL